MNNINLLTSWDFRQPVRQRTDYCAACGKYKSTVERWNECTCKAALAKFEQRHLDALINIPLSSEYDFGLSKTFGVNAPLKQGCKKYTTYKKGRYEK